jgi:hypothetical protein
VKVAERFAPRILGVVRAGFSFVLLAALACAQQPSAQETAAAVELSRKVALEYGKSLPDFMCTQLVRRYQDMTHRSLWRAVDLLTIRLSYYEHNEDHKLVLVDGKPTEQTYSALQGTITVGEFGATLLQIFDPASAAAFKWEKWTHSHKRPAAVYAYQVDLANSKYGLNFRLPDKQYHTMVGFHGVVEVDRESGEVLHLTYVADRIPKDFPIRASETSVDYDLAEIGGKEFLLPAVSETELKSLDIWTRKKAEFRDYRKFSAESTVTFGPAKQP